MGAGGGGGEGKAGSLSEIPGRVGDLFRLRLGDGVDTHTPPRVAQRVVIPGDTHRQQMGAAFFLMEFGVS